MWRLQLVPSFYYAHSRDQTQVVWLGWQVPLPIVASYQPWYFSVLHCGDGMCLYAHTLRTEVRRQLVGVVFSFLYKIPVWRLSWWILSGLSHLIDLHRILHATCLSLACSFSLWFTWTSKGDTAGAESELGFALGRKMRSLSDLFIKLVPWPLMLGTETTLEELQRQK